MLSGFVGIAGLVGGILAIIFGIIVIIKPQILAWLIGIYLIIAGILTIVSTLTSRTPIIS